MDWERPKEPADVGLLGWMSVLFGVLGILSHALCCVAGVFSLLLTVMLTAIGLVLGYVGFRSARDGGDQHALSLVGLFLGGFNFLVLCIIALMQCYLVGIVVAMIFIDT